MSPMVVLISLMSPASWQPPAVPKPVHFDSHVIPILTRFGCNSGACHGALAGKGGFKLSLRGYDPDADHFAMTRQALGRRIDTAAPEKSLLLRKATRAITHGGGTRFDDESRAYRILTQWIAQGAAGPTAAAPKLVRIEARPAAVTGKPKATQQLTAIAHFDDGHTEDVTAWAKFSSSEEPVATVDELGQVTITGPGVAGITVAFGSRIATSTVTVPYPHTVDAAVYERSPRVNPIDDLILKRLRELNLPPSQQADDRTFIRRVYLDTTGRLPTVAQADDFLKDSRPDKRARLIDSLIGSPAFIDYWTLKWCDLFLVSSRELSQPAMWAYYRSLREAVAANTPWDRFAREMLTVSGSNITHGAANYFTLHKDPSHLAEATAITFLGTSIGCAKCHNHPLEKWTQDQYWAFTNLFARVGHKNGDFGEMIVHPRSDGDAFHPRRGRPMPPAPLDGPVLPLDSSSDRRRHLADWLTSPENPYFAKAIVNRLWKATMGRGLVEAEDDLRDSNPPSNRELFDWLARDLVDHKFDLRHTLKQILNSAAYQRSSFPLKDNAADDRFYSRYLIRRLPAEVILDAYSDLTGVPTPFNQVAVGASGGFADKKDYPPGTRAVQLPDSLLVSNFLDQFGRAERGQPCACERTADASVGQALHVSNGQTLNDKLRHESSIVSAWLRENRTDDQIVQQVFLMALARRPTDAERKPYLAALNGAKTPAERREVLEDMLWAVLTGREFLFNH